jgi:molybdopterin/thiamine biosynthesis adenylyltransferase
MDPGRYSRHALIDWFPQARVRAARIAVVGAGAVGNEVVKNLALLGVGAVDVFDFDRVELHNLTRSIFLREDDVGAPKAEALAARAATVDPAVEVRGFVGDFRDQLSLSQLARYGCAVAAVDNFEARLGLSEMCLLAGVDLVNAGINSRHAIVETFPFGHAQDCACYACHLPESAYQRVAERYSCGGLKRAAQAERLIPTTAITASIAGAFAASAALRLGADDAPQSRRTLIDTRGGTGGSVALGRNPDCVGCGPLRPRPRLVRARNAWSPTIAPPAETWIRTSEPIIVACECASCGDRSAASQYALRRARDFDDRISVCRACGRPAVRIEIRDHFAAEELATLFAARPLPVPYVVATHAQGATVLDLVEDEASMPSGT